MIRLAHFSDIHVTSRTLQWKRADWFNKRMAAWLNLRWLGRGRRFRYCDDVMQALVADLRARQPDHLVFSGDATALGFESEFQRAATFLEVNDETTIPGFAVPGNHDYCTKHAAESGLFEQYFDRWQDGERIDGHRYPFAQKVGDIWLVGVNSATANRWAWNAGGAVGPAQLERLRILLNRLSPTPRILVTHYPVTLSNGKPEPRVRGMRDLHEMLDICEKCGVSLWLHGHRHHRYIFEKSPLASFPTICSGSATQSDLWSYGEYELDGYQLRGVFRQYDPQERKFQASDTFELVLPTHASEPAEVLAR